MTVGFLHTSPLHVPTFDALLVRTAPGRTAVHLVREELLADARAAGATSVAEPLRAALAELVAGGAEVVVCTCSTLGPVAEATAVVGPRGRVPVLRVDRPAADRVVDLARQGGGTVGVVVALESTVAPTRDLLVEAGAERVELVLAEDAWRRFEAGDVAGYLRTVERAVRDLAPRVAVVLLAQASMAPVADAVSDLADERGVPAVATPRAAVEAAVATLER